MPHQCDRMPVYEKHLPTRCIGRISNYLQVKSNVLEVKAFRDMEEKYHVFSQLCS